MNAKPAHREEHFTASELVRDLVIGMSDGLTVPFALAAGLAGAVSNHWLIVIAGASEIAAGSIAMGLGGYLAARGDADLYAAELAREQREIVELPDRERQEIEEIFIGYGLSGQALEAATEAIVSNPDSWLRFMMREELGLDQPDPRRARTSGATIAGAYVVGGMVPLAPYLFPISVNQALALSAVLTLIVLSLFGYLKARIAGLDAVRGAAQTAILGALAAGAAYLISRIISGAAGI